MTSELTLMRRHWPVAIRHFGTVATVRMKRSSTLASKLKNRTGRQTQLPTKYDDAGNFIPGAKVESRKEIYNFVSGIQAERGFASIHSLGAVISKSTCQNAPPRTYWKFCHYTSDEVGVSHLATLTKFIYS